MARSQLFSLACLALLASSALAAPACVSTDAVIQTAVLTSDKPKGCLDKNIGQTGLDSKCFESVTLYREAGPGCNGFNISLLDGSGTDNCPGGPIGNGTLSAAVGGGYTAKGKFLTEQQFTGTESADNKTLTVSVPEFNCVLTYAFKANTTAANATAGNGTTAALPGTTTRDNGAPSSTATPAPPPKNGVAAALPSAALLVLGAVMALAL